jgi:hypothetical protein
MPTTITINDITGSTPCNIYLCDQLITTCIFVDTVSVFPYSFDVPSILDGQLSYNLKTIDSNGCEVINNLIVP